jgi:cell division septation protein DedD/tetratricopeptide (TPR) repeat protein
MNTIFRAGWLAVAFLLAAGRLSAQNETQEELLRADKQFDLYAYNLALHTYQQVLQKDAKNTHAMARIADCYYQLNRPEESLSYYDKAVLQKDVDPIVQFHYGEALMQTGDYAGAKKWFTNYAETNLAVGKHYAEMCDYALRTSKMDPGFVARNEPLNTESADYSPAFNGNRVVFNSSRTDIKRKVQSKTNADWSGSAYNQLFVTQRNPETGFLQKPLFLHTDLQNSYNEGPVSYSADGKRVAFCRNNFIDGTRQIAEKGLNMSLYTADVADNGNWENIKAFPFNGSDYACGFPCLSADGKTLLFASNQTGGFGGWDIYSSTFTAANGWGTPRNLGAPLNTPGNEVTPYYDGKFLYFSSDWHPGLGGMDVFRAELNQDEVTNVSQLGPGINSAQDDYGFIYNPDQNVGYLTSNRPGGRGGEDIWQITKKLQDLTVAAKPQVYAAPAPKTALAAAAPTENPDGYYYLQVTDEAGKPVPNAEVDLLDCAAGSGRTDGTGKYYFEALNRPSDCHVTISGDGLEDATVDLYAFGKQNVMVGVRHDKQQEFIGKVLDSRTRIPINGAIIEYVIPGTDKLVQTSTDQVGSYAIKLEPGLNYSLNYSASGHNDATVKTKPVASISGNKLQDIYLESIQTVATSLKTPPPAQFAGTGAAPAMIAKGPSPVQAPVAVSKLTGYSVQVAASPDKLNLDKLKKYEGLSKYGNIYVKADRGLNKVRLGIFPNKDEAQKNLKDITKNTNYKTAFVVEERDADESLVVGPPASNLPVTSNNLTAKGLTAPATPAPAVPNTSTNASIIRYSVQLASFASDKPINFNDYSGVSKYGNVYTKTENGMTKVRIGVFADYADAEKASKDVMTKGFKDPMVVTERADDPNIKGFLLPDAPNVAPAVNSMAKTDKTAGLAAKSVALPAPVAKSTGNYYVKIAALSDPDRFDPRPFEGMGGGQIEKLPGDKGLTNIVLGGYPDLESATTAQNKVLNKGIKGAYVVVKDANGKLIRQ